MTFTTMAQETPVSPVLTGKTDIQKLTDAKAYPWFNANYQSYKPAATTAAELKKNLPADATILVFGGTWCSDTQNLLPKFYKTLDEAGIPRKKVELYLVDEQKNSPEALEKQYGVISVPTFIVLQQGEERGRVVESIQESIEADLLKIVQKW